MAEIYTVSELEAKIRALDLEIEEVRRRPAQQSLDGNFVSFAGVLSSLMSERADLMRRHTAAQAAAAGRSSGQGPRSFI